MNVKLYVLPSSTSSRKAKSFLLGKNINFEEHDMNKNPLTWEQLFEILMYTENGVEDILSLRSKDYLELFEQGVDFDELSLTELHSIIMNRPRILRAPILVAKNTTMVGYNEEAISVLDNRKDKKEAYLKVLDMLKLNENVETEDQKRSKWDRAAMG